MVKEPVEEFLLRIGERQDGEQGFAAFFHRTWRPAHRVPTPASGACAQGRQELVLIKCQAGLSYL